MPAAAIHAAQLVQLDAVQCRVGASDRMGLPSAVTLDWLREVEQAVLARHYPQLKRLGVHVELFGKRLVEFEANRQIGPPSWHCGHAHAQEQLLLGELEEGANCREWPKLPRFALRPELTP